MSTIIDVSSKLGEYMLKGWVLTDKICKHCSKVPLMRSPSGPATYCCVNCDISQPAPSVNASALNNTGSATQSQPSTSSTVDSLSHESRPSTPLTEMSSALSSPVFAPAMDTDEILQRRQQSDTASSEIGKRLLKGWAMLADECPNQHCYGVPLVRPPKSSGEKALQKECVICHTVYINDVDHNGVERLVPLPSSMPPTTLSLRAAVLPPSKPSVSAKGKEIGPSAQNTQLDQINLYDSSTLRSVELTARSLEQSLRSLTERLDFLSSGYSVDAVLIGQTADAISKVSQALIQVKLLRRSELETVGS